jgi:acetyl-CoA acetyltransferase
LTDAYIYDRVQIPRGNGRSDDGRHEITPIRLATQTLSALRARSDPETSLIDDLMWGCVMPVALTEGAAEADPLSCCTSRGGDKLITVCVHASVALVRVIHFRRVLS